MILDEFREFHAARRQARLDAERAARLYQVLVNDPWDFSLIEKIAEKHGFHFTVKNKDGSELVFAKNGYGSTGDSITSDDW